MISLAQAVKRQQPVETPTATAAENDTHTHKEPDDVEFGPHLEKVQEAGRAVLQAVKAAFDRGRKPTPDDVVAITAQLDNVAAAVVAGRHATATTSNCSHVLTEFRTEKAGFFCNACREVMQIGASMA